MQASGYETREGIKKGEGTGFVSVRCLPQTRLRVKSSAEMERKYGDNKPLHDRQK